MTGTPRSFVIVASGLALLAGAGIVIIALAFLTGGEEATGTPAVMVSPTAAVAPATATLSPEPRSPGPASPTTIGAATKPTLTPTAPTPTPTSTPPVTATPPPEPSAAATPSRPPPSPPAALKLPDLTVLDLVVSGDRVSAVIGNAGGAAVPPGTTVQMALRGALAGSSTLPQGLSAGGNFTMLLAQEFVYRQESVTAVVDPSNLVPEANETNNGLTRQLDPDVLLDLALTGLSAVDADDHLLVTVLNNSPVPAHAVQTRISVYRSIEGSPMLSTALYELDLQPQSAITLSPGIAGVRGGSFRVVLEVMGIVDGNPANNVLNSLVP